MKRDRWVAVIGLGFVGLPLVQLLVEKGYSVLGIDIDRRKISSLQEGRSYLSDFTDEEMKELIGKGTFIPTEGYEEVGRAEYIIIAVPTPLREREPDLTAVKAVFHTLHPYLRSGQTVILESSTYPGTTEEMVKRILEETGFQVGKEIFLGYSPERIEPGNDSFSLAKIPKVISGVTSECLGKVKELYGDLFETIVPVSSPKTAEFVKMLENGQRLVNISFINEINMLAHRLKVDVWEVIEAAKTKPYGFTPYYPSAGAGGHCIPVDPVYLAWSARREGMRLRMIEEASRVNELIPHFVMERAVELLEREGIPLEKAKVGVIGITYKKDVNDIRESAALKVVRLLQERGVEVEVHDPLYSEDLPRLPRFPWEGEKIRSFDLILILVDHSRIPWEELIRYGRLIYDTRNVTRRVHAPHVVRG
ncbi:UDP-N-acetyl-D-glucosamine 6-dehydrogenase [[Clostridium] ultunense Esp]|nr:UDP-N-acetyl-D-glucosamine 6-dehydrogenase [[Clostridium] ultunense Esp]